MSTAQSPLNPAQSPRNEAVTSHQRSATTILYVNDLEDYYY